MSLKKILQFSFLVLIFISCSSTKENGGGGTETGDPGATENLKGGLIGGSTVLDSNSRIALKEASVWVDNEPSKKVTSGENGDYLINNLSYGEHTVYAKWTEDGVLLMGKSETFEIGNLNGDQKPFIYLGKNIILSDPANLTGMISNTNLSNPKVSLLNTIFTGTVQSNGVIQLKEVPAGSYTLEITSGGRVVYSKEVELIAGETFDLGIISVAP